MRTLDDITVFQNRSTKVVNNFVNTAESRYSKDSLIIPSMYLIGFSSNFSEMVIMPKGYHGPGCQKELHGLDVNYCSIKK